MRLFHVLGWLCVLLARNNCGPVEEARPAAAGQPETDRSAVLPLRQKPFVVNGRPGVQADEDVSWEVEEEAESSAEEAEELHIVMPVVPGKANNVGSKSVVIPKKKAQKVSDQPSQEDASGPSAQTADLDADTNGHSDTTKNTAPPPLNNRISSLESRNNSTVEKESGGEETDVDNVTATTHSSANDSATRSAAKAATAANKADKTGPKTKDPAVAPDAGKTKAPVGSPASHEGNSEAPNEADGSDVDNRITNNNHWKEISRFNLSSNAPVIKYRSELTGLTVVLAKSDSPIVNGYLCLATEAHDNDGLPHTLEHLIFLGSEDYPYKEVLDLLANRCLADRTNAWTDTDHTCYTVYTAGSSGFLIILPIYLDHILYPLLREEDYLTEVHHVNGEGLDAGVVYSEMQGVEHSSSNIMYFHLADIIYPGNSGYGVETGGYLHNLRNSTNIHKVREYHKQFYRPENLVLTLTGTIEEEELFVALRKIEEKVLRKREVNPADPYVRPWQSKISAISPQTPHVSEVKYPSEDESLGNVAVAWRLPMNISDDVEILQAYELLMKYLSTTQVSPLEAEFVESSDPLSTGVSADMLELREPTILIEFENVPVARIDEVVPRMEAILNRIVKDGPGKFDIERIHNFIERTVVNSLKDTENSPHLFLPDAVVLDMLYGQKPENLQEFTLSSQLYKVYRDKDAAFWIGLIQKIFIDLPKYVVKGLPSTQKLREETIEEEERITRQIEELGKAGLVNKQQIIDKAINSQVLPSKQVLQKVPFGDIHSIRFRGFTSYNRTYNNNNSSDNSSNNNSRTEDGVSISPVNFNSIPLKIHLDDVHSKFVQMYLFLNTSVLTTRERKYLPLLLDTWFVSPLEKDGIITPIEDVVKRRTKTLQQIRVSLGFDGSTFSPGANGEAIVIEAQAELRKFDQAVEYASDALLYPKFTAQKINSTAGNLLNKIPTKKQSPEDVLRAFYDGFYFNNQSNIYQTSFLRQKEFIESVTEKLETDPDAVISEMGTIVQKLARPENAFVYLATDLPELAKQFGRDLPVLKTLFNQTETKFNLSERYDLTSESIFRRNLQNSKLPRHVMAGVGGTESCYMKQSILYNNSDWYDKESGDIRVMLQYLSDRMYDEVRGQGLTYGVSMSLSITEGRITLRLTRSSRLVEAYSTVREILHRYGTEENTWDPTLLDSARGSMVYSWAEKEETVEDLISQSIKCYMRKTDNRYNREFVSLLADVELEGVKKNARNLLPAFLDSSATQTVVVCNPAAVPDIVHEFKNQFDIELTTFDSLDESFLTEP